MLEWLMTMSVEEAKAWLTIFAVVGGFAFFVWGTSGSHPSFYDRKIDD